MQRAFGQRNLRILTIMILKQVAKAGIIMYVSIPLKVLLLYLEVRNSPTKRTSRIPNTTVTFNVFELRLSARYAARKGFFVRSILLSVRISKRRNCQKYNSDKKSRRAPAFKYWSRLQQARNDHYQARGHIRNLHLQRSKAGPHWRSDAVV